MIAELPPALTGTVDDIELTAQWRTGPVDAIVAVEVWGRPALRDGLVRIVAGDIDLDAGEFTAGGTDAALVLFRPKAAEAFGEEWLAVQALNVLQALTHRWATPWSDHVIAETQRLWAESDGGVRP